MDNCQHCGWPLEQPYEIVSRHLTSEGILVYTRCACGTLQARLLGWRHPGRVISPCQAGPER
ncbi:MAG: hypothetical protein GEV03_26540 [Streptosporangiales bacterium]|nr:hypothetical protein [Streptosporangiales bacterium]